MSQNIITVENKEEILVQYGCSLCGYTWFSKELCDEHIANCVQSTLEAHDPLKERSSNRAPKRKLDHCIDTTDSENISDDCASNKSSNNACESKKSKGFNVDLQAVPDNITLGNTICEATSQMISDTEMLITLPYNQINNATGGPLDFSNEVAIGFEEHTQELHDFQQGYKPHRYSETENENTVIIENLDVEDFANIDQDSTVKILSVFTAEASQKDEADTQDNKEFQKNIEISNDIVEATENESNKILTVLNTVDVNQCDTPGEEVTLIELHTENILVEEEGFEIEREVQYECDNEGESLKRREVENTRPVDEETKKIKKNMAPLLDNKKPQKKRVSSKQRINRTNLLAPAKRKVNEKLTNPKNNHQMTQKKLQESHDSQGRKGMLAYSRIEVHKEQKEPEKPSKFSVFEFFDEEEEKLKAKMEEECEKEKALKRRTCKLCNEVFNDPIDVLRHKRKFHKHSKIFLSKEELEPYFAMEKKTECPICFKIVSPKGYNSLYVKHLMTHCDEYDFICKVCGMQFRRKDHWYNHETRHVVRPEDSEKD